MAMLVLMSTNFHMPEIPEPGQVKLHVWLQDTAWLEADVPNRLKARPFTGEPIFCFETALKLDYFCHLLYDIEEVPDAVCTLETALGLYDLTHHKLIWKRDVDAKCLAAWNPETGRIVLGFRGTASVANVLDDLKVWRSAYLPVTGSYWLGTMPMVHYGFIRHWIRSGLQAEVLETIGDIMKTPPTNGSGRWRVLITGHSLGGAVCKLAGYDIANAAKTLSPGAAIDLSYVTYGCPRVGNEAFAKKLHRLIPDGWDVMHPDDIVANGGKFIFMYKRESFPVILTTMGDLIVRPSYMERHVRGTTGQSIQEHLLTTYTMSLAEVMKGQFKNKELEGGKEALLKLWDCAFVRQMVEDAAVGLKSEAIAELGQIASEAHAAQSVKKKDDTHVARGETMRRRQSLRHAAVQLASFSNPERPKADGGDRLV